MPDVTVKLTAAMIAAIDAMRGNYMSRERWLYRAVQQVIADGLRPATPGQDDEEEG